MCTLQKIELCYNTLNILFKKGVLKYGKVLACKVRGRWKMYFA